MAITIPETEPLEFYSGTTVKWKRTDLSDYPAPTWTLNYFLQKSGTKIDFASSQDGSTTGHLISLTPATTAGYTVGLYHWIVEARDGTDVYVVDEGYMEIKTDFAEQTSGYDDRSVAKKMMDAYESLFSNQITNSTLEQLSYSIAGRSISKMSASEIRMSPTSTSSDSFEKIPLTVIEVDALTSVSVADTPKSLSIILMSATKSIYFLSFLTFFGSGFPS